MKKVCSKCKEEKDLLEFHKNKSAKSGVHHYCKKCNSVQRKRTYNYDQSRKIRILNSYKINIDDVQKIYILQNKKCKICKTENPSVSNYGGLHIDHCHVTGEVRGLLCNSCNILLGLAKDNISILNSAIDYLKK
jgi:HD-GYP domain-containing protein (c-di-GMP phosphodiesterase class II)